MPARCYDLAVLHLVRNLADPEPLRHRDGRPLPCRYCHSLIAARVARGKLVAVTCLLCMQRYTVDPAGALALLAHRPTCRKVTR